MAKLDKARPVWTKLGKPGHGWANQGYAALNCAKQD